MVLGGRKVSHCEMHLCPASAIDPLVLRVYGLFIRVEAHSIKK